MHLTIPVESLFFSVLGGLCVVEMFASMSAVEFILFMRFIISGPILYTFYISTTEEEPVVFAVEVPHPPCERCVKRQERKAAKRAAAASDSESVDEIYERVLQDPPTTPSKPEPTTEFSDLIRNPL